MFKICAFKKIFEYSNVSSAIGGGDATIWRETPTCLSFSPNIFRKAPSNRQTKKNKSSASRYSKHAQTGYPHASLQLFHQAVTLDVNPGGERQKKGRRQGGEMVQRSSSENRRGSGLNRAWAQRMPQSKNPPCQWSPALPQPTSQWAFIWAHTRGAGAAECPL